MRHAEAGHGDGQAAGVPEQGPAGGDRHPAQPTHRDRGLRGRKVQRPDERRAVRLISGLYDLHRRVKFNIYYSRPLLNPSQ